VTLAAERLARHNVHLVGVVGRTTNAPWWSSEVENFLLIDAPKQVLARTGHVLLVREDGVIVAVVAHRSHERFNAELLQALLVLPEHRGHGLAESVLRCALADIHRSAGARYVMWLVHHDNEYMLKASNKVAGGPIGPPDDIGFVTYIEP
jgi:ribosomal protein S18 acetylase RimI-like enzyme